MTTAPGTTQAEAVYDLLVAKAGANPRGTERLFFVESLMLGCTEYRFQGLLGFGGKLYVESRGMRVSCYREDETPERRAIIREVNAELAKLNAD